MKIVLASTSPFRKTILEKLGLPFDTLNPETDETRFAGESPEQLVQRLARAKAKAVAGTCDDALIIGSDQVAAIDNEILGKPGTHDKAVKQLQLVSAKTVRFFTGLCLLNTATGNYQLDVVLFDVVFRKLTDMQIENYLQKEKPYNCAGSFKSEALGICLFEKLQGDDPNTLMGLPLIRLVRMLEQEGVAVI